jgi:PAS domain S-box-containing protein
VISRPEQPDALPQTNGDPNAVANGRLMLVGIGASAGGIEALTTFFDNMPADSGLAFVVILHLSPQHESQLAEVLQPRTKMQVRQVVDREKVEANRVYVIPPDQNLAMSNGHIHLTARDKASAQQVPVDFFFRTLASSYQERAIAVVLSGAGTDGSIGVRLIKEAGGVSFAQDPTDAEHNGMPRSAIETGAIDFILPVARMPEKLVALKENAQRIQLPAPDARDETPDETALLEVLALLRARTKHDFSNYKRATLLRRLERRLQVTECVDIPCYLAFVREHPAELQGLLRDLLISVTNFFRDPLAFDVLAREIVPRLFTHKGPSDQVRVWVTACATGEEAYSLAILLSECAARLDRPPRIQIFATDINDEAIAIARAGIYPEAIAADVSPERLRQFFVPEGQYFRIKRELREMVLFTPHNILRDPPFSKLDLITCRNLLIYVNRQMQDRVLQIFHFSLRPDSFLMLGSAETADSVPALFAPIDKKQRIYGRVSTSGPQLPPSLPLAGQWEAKIPVLRAEHVETHSGSFTYNELHFSALEAFAPPSVLVNSDHEIVHLSDGAARYLRLGGGEPSRNLFKVAHPDLRIELRALLRTAPPGDAEPRTHGVMVNIDGESRLVNLHVRPVEGVRGSPGYFLVVFEEAREPQPAAAIMPVSPTDSAAQREMQTVVQHFEDELQRSHDHLRSTVEEAETSTEELKASNEELQAVNEELRSAGEELETGKEEMQSVNEELVTVNNELKEKVDELSRSNSDLQNLMASTEIGTLFLDRALCITRYTPGAVALFRLRTSDLGRPLTDLNHRLNYPELTADAEQVLEKLIPIKREVSDGEHWFLAQLLPYRTAEDRIAGVVLSFVDITETREAVRAQAELAEKLARQTRIFDTALSSIADFVYTFDREGRFTFANQPLCRLLGRSIEEVAGHNFHELGYPPELATQLQAEIEHVFTMRESVVGETPFTSPSGEPGYYEYIFQPVIDAAGAVETVAGSTRVITDRKRVETVLRESEARIAADLAGMRRLYELQSKLADEHNLKAALEEVLAVACEFTGTDRGCVQLLSPDGERLEMFAWHGYADDSPFITAFRYEGLEEGCEVARVHRQRLIIEETIGFPGLVGNEAEAAVQAEGIRAAQSTPLTSRSGETIGVLSTQFREPHRSSEHELRLVDMLAWTAAEFLERHHAHAALRANEERLRRALSIQTVGVLYFRLDGRIDDANAAFQRMCGYSLNELRTTAHWEKLTAPEFIERTMRIAQNLAGRGETPPYEKVMIRPDGTRWWGLFAPTRLSGSGTESECVEFIIDITAAKATQEALRAREEWLRIMADAVPQIIWTNDANAAANYFNLRWYEFSGLTFEQSAGVGWQAIVHPDDDLVSSALWRRAQEAGEVFDTEYRLRGADGAYRWFIGRNVPSLSAEGQVTGWFGTATDIQELKETGAALSASEEQFRRAIEDAPIPVIMHAEDGQVLQISKTWTELTGYAAEDIPTFEAWLTKAYGDGADAVRENVHALFRSEAQLRDSEVDITTRTGEQRRWSFSASAPGKLRDGRRFIVAMALDITERKEAEEAVRESQERLRLIVENARDYAIFSLDLDRRITSWNSGAQAILGYTAEEAIGLSGDVIFTAEDYDAGAAKVEAEAAIREGRATDERWHLRKDGTRFWGSGVMMAMHDAEGRAIGLVKIFRDQTSELHAKEALDRHSQELWDALMETERARSEAEAANRTKDQFLAVLSHELRTPLTPVLMIGQTLLGRKDLPPLVRDGLETICNNVKLEAHFIDDLLDVTSISRGKFTLVKKPVALHDAVRRAIEISRPDISAKDQQLTIELNAEADQVSGDLPRLQQVFWNLLKNASKFTPEGGELRVKSRVESDAIIVEVIDTGRGIDPEALAGIFEAFRQENETIAREFGGLGLGLAISKATIEAHGGNIDVASAGRGQGTTLSVELPLLNDSLSNDAS